MASAFPSALVDVERRRFRRNSKPSGFSLGLITSSQADRAKLPRAKRCRSVNGLVIAALVQFACAEFCIGQQLPVPAQLVVVPTPLSAGPPFPNGTMPAVSFVSTVPPLSAGPSVARGTPVFPAYTPSIAALSAGTPVPRGTSVFPNVVTTVPPSVAGPLTPRGTTPPLTFVPTNPPMSAGPPMPDGTMPVPVVVRQ